MIRSAVLTALLAVTPLALPAQNPSAPVSGSYTISGIVRSATTGAPLDRAQVTLVTAGAQETPVGAMATGEGGVFRFDHLAPGKYALSAARRGYIASRYQEHEGGYSTAIVTGPDLVSTGLQFDLFPGAVIGGAITDDTGSPVAGAHVTLYRQQREEGATKIVNADTDMTADDGTWEFNRLGAGTYYIAVSATPWYAFRAPRRTRGHSSSDDQPEASPLDAAYPMTFYANATDSGSATPIQLNPGDHPELDLTLHAVPAVHVEVRGPKPDGAHGFSVPQLSQEVFGAEQFQPPSQIMVRNVGDQVLIDFDGVAPGHYSLRDFNSNGVTRSASVDLTTDQSVDFTTAPDATDVSGKIEMSSGAALPQVTMLQLTPAGGGASVNAVVSAGGSFDLRSVSPGDYAVQVNTSTGALAVVQMAASGAEVHGSRITVGTDPVLLAAMVARGSVSVTGFARREGKGVGGALILLVPEHPQDNRDLVRRDQSDSDGSFTLQRVLPGNYTVVAIQNGWSLDWSRPDVLAPWLARGLRLRITDEDRSVDLPSALEVQ